MGRTIPTAAMLIQQEMELFLRTYGKGLDASSDKKMLYNVLQLPKKHTQACSQSVRLVPFHAILVSILLEQQKQIEKLVEEIAKVTEAQ